MHEHAFAQGQNGTLLLLDYPELYPEALTSLLAWFSSGQMPPGRWRILLLSRDERLAQSIDQHAPGRRDASLELSSLAGEEHAWQLFHAASQQMRTVNAGSEAGRQAAILQRQRFAAWLAQDAHHHDPLMSMVIQFDGFSFVFGQDR
ncbi:MAG: hypothetical protein RL748_3654 [Pseudomonadota bacterium]|jgi:hypothetical protein